MKVSYDREKKLLGYVVWLVSYDDNWALSLAGMYGRDTALLVFYFLKLIFLLSES